MKTPLQISSRLAPCFALLLTACFAEFPPPADSVVPRADAGIEPDDAGVEPDAERRLDDARPRDDAAMDAQAPEPDAAPLNCDEIKFGVDLVRIRSWGRAGEPAQARVPVEGLRCPGVVARAEDGWLSVEFADRGSALVATASLGRLAPGRHETKIMITFEGTTTSVPVLVDLLYPTQEPTTPFVLVIGADGLVGGAIEAANTPALDWLISGAAYTADAKPFASPTPSAAAWATILSGVSPAEHGVSGDQFGRWNGEFPTFITRVKRRLDLRTGMAERLPPLANVLHEPGDIDVLHSGEGSARMLGSAISTRDIRLSFVHAFNVDDAGQASSFDPADATYRAAVEKLDDTVDELIGAIVKRPNLAKESWLIVLTADNGGDSSADSPVPLLVAGSSMVPEPIAEGSQYDVFPTVMAFLGLPPGAVVGNVIGGGPRETECEDGADNDDDGRADCDDTDCRFDPSCLQELCDNGIDDDGDGRTDCADGDCAGDLACVREEVCDNGIDDDGDGKTDCDDDECVDRPVCQQDLACDAVHLGSNTGLAVASGTTVGGTNLVELSCTNDGPSPERLFHFTAPARGDYVFNTVGSQYDTLLALYDEDCESAETECDDDLAPGPRRMDDGEPLRQKSMIRAPLAAGQTVAIAVDGWNGEQGDFQLNIHPFVCGGPLLVHDQPGGAAIAFGNNTDAPTFFGPQQVDQIQCGLSARDLQWTWVVPATGAYVFHTVGSEIDTVFNILTSNCEESRACREANDGPAAVLRRAEAGDTFVIVVSGRWGATGNIQLNIEPR